MRARTLAIAAGAAIAAAALYWRRNPSACPYGQRFWVEAPHPLITRGRMLATLAPAPGERVLEVGPGTGYYSLDVARAVAPDGELVLLDIQQQMLDHVMRRALEAGVAERIQPVRGDATKMPFDDERFDAALIVAALGEIPDQDAALRELARVVRPGGRLVVGELFGDPHFVTSRSLQRRAAAAGLRYDRRNGGPLGFFAVLRREAASPAEAPPVTA